MRFYSGDYVRVAKDLGRSMSHFQSDCDAVVIGSYGDRFGGEDHNSYTIHIRGRGQVSWYYGEQLELLERARHDLIEAWEAEEEAEEKLKSDIDWIFANGEEVIHTPHGASINTLAACLGIKNMWGLNGEGITYYHNFLLTMMAAKEYLKTGDKAGFLAFAAGTMDRVIAQLERLQKLEADLNHELTDEECEKLYKGLMEGGGIHNG